MNLTNGAASGQADNTDGLSFGTPPQENRQPRRNGQRKHHPAAEVVVGPAARHAGSKARKAAGASNPVIESDARLSSYLGVDGYDLYEKFCAANGLVPGETFDEAVALPVAAMTHLAPEFAPTKAQAAADASAYGMRDPHAVVNAARAAKANGATTTKATDPLEVETQKQMLRLMGLAEAQRRISSVKVAEVELPPVLGLADLLAQDDDPIQFRIEDVFPSGGARIIFAAPEKAGKTTLLGNLARSLADGDPFLGKFAVNTPARRIVVIDNEMSTGMMRRWLRRQGIRNTGAVADVVTLRGRAGLFDLGDDRMRGEWARRLGDLGCDFLIFDCLRPVLDALGLDENRETGKFLGPFDALLAEAGCGDAVIAHHMGHSSERARGDSRIIGWSDGNWKVVRQNPDDPTSPKFFDAQVRDGDPVPEGLLTYDPETRHLTYAGGNRAQAKADKTVEDKLTEVLRVLADRKADGYDGMNTTDLQKAVTGKAVTIRKALDLGRDRKEITVTETGPAKVYRLASGDPMAR